MDELTRPAIAPRDRGRRLMPGARVVGRVVPIVLMIAIGAVVAAPDRADAHGIGGIQPSNYETRVLSVSPSVPGVHVRSVDLGNQLELRTTTDDLPRSTSTGPGQHPPRAALRGGAAHPGRDDRRAR